MSTSSSGWKSDIRLAKILSIDGVHTVTTREQVGRWRNEIFAELRKRESREALDGISRIQSQFPELEWLHFARLGLEKAVEGTEWKPASPRELTNWISSYQRPRLKKIEYLRRYLKKHRNTILTVAAIVLTVLAAVFTVSATVFLPEIRQFFGLENTASVEPTDTSYSENVLEEPAYTNPATEAATDALQTASNTPAATQQVATRSSRLDTTPRPATPVDKE